MGNLATDRRHLEEALTLQRRLGNPRGVAMALWGFGYQALEEGDLVGGLRTLEESVATLREIGDEHHILHVTRTLA